MGRLIVNSPYAIFGEVKDSFDELLKLVVPGQMAAVHARLTDQA